MVSVSTDDALRWGTLVLALYGAGLSTALGIRSFWDDRRRLMVSCNLSIASLVPGSSTEFVVVRAVNVGKRMVEVRTAGLVLSDGKQYTQGASRMGRQPFGKKLADGESADFYFDTDQIENALRQAKPQLDLKGAFVTDAEGKRHTATIPDTISRLFQKAAAPAPLPPPRDPNAPPL